MHTTFESYNNSKIIRPIDKAELKTEQEIRDSFTNKRDTSGHNWTFDDFVLVVYYYKYGFRKLQLTVQQVANIYIGTTEASFVMQLANIRKLYGETENVLSDYTPTQLAIAKWCDSLTENELQDKVENILDGVSDEQKEENEELVRLKEERLEQEREVRKQVKDKKEAKEKVKQLNKSMSDLITHKKVSLADLTDQEKDRFKQDVVEYKQHNEWKGKESIEEIINNILKDR